jgi:hypothetical protein
MEMDEFKQIQFLKDIHNEIVSEYLKNYGMGYIKLCVDEHYNLVQNSMEFIVGPFETDKFQSFTMFKEVHTPGTVVSGIYIYYSIIWYSSDGANSTTWNLKEFFEIPSTDNFWE